MLSQYIPNIAIVLCLHILVRHVEKHLSVPRVELERIERLTTVRSNLDVVSVVVALWKV